MRFPPRVGRRTPASRAGTIGAGALSRGKVPLNLFEWGLIGHVMVFP